MILQLNGAPASAQILQSIEQIQVVLADEGRSGFQIVFRANRSDDKPNGFDQLLAMVPQKEQRIVLSVQFDGDPVVLIDGYILYQELSFENGGETASITATGEDIAFKLDVDETILAYSQKDDATIVNEILGRYSSLLTANVVAPSTVITPSENGYLPIQRGTDLQYIEELANRYDHKVYLNFKSPKSELYWGPPVVSGKQPDLIYALDPFTNVTSLRITYDSLKPTKTFGSVQDRATDVISSLDVESASSEAITVSTASALALQSVVRKRLSTKVSGVLQTEAQSWGQGAVDQSSTAVRIEGELDSLRYGQPLLPRSPVNLRGVHPMHDGEYYVQKVTHVLRPQGYRQRFVVIREGIDAAS